MRQTGFNIPYAIAELGRVQSLTTFIYLWLFVVLWSESFLFIYFFYLV